MKRSKLRLLFVSHAYPPIDGGVATSTKRLASNLAKQDCDVVVLTFLYGSPGEGDVVEKVEADGAVTVIRIGPFYRHHDIDDNEAAESRRKVYDKMETIALAFGPSLVLSFYAANAGLLGAYLANRCHVPHIVGLRGNDVSRNIFSTKWLPTLGHILEMSAHVVCVNDHLKSRLLLAFPTIELKTSVITNGIDDTMAEMNGKGMEYIRDRVAWPLDTVKAVFIGTPREKKGIYVLLDAITRLPPAARPRLLVVGPDLKQEAGCRRQLWNKLIEERWLHVTGQLSRDEALSAASGADIVTMPSLDDGLANGLLEGMSLGLCPVASDIFKEVVVPDVCGWLVPRNNPTALAEALASATTNHSMRQRFGEAARSRIRSDFSALSEANQYRSLFERLTAKSHLQ